MNSNKEVDSISEENSEACLTALLRGIKKYSVDQGDRLGVCLMFMFASISEVEVKSHSLLLFISE